MRHEPDPAKPEGIARPPIVEAINAKERAWSFSLLMGDLATVCDRDGDTEAAATYRVGVRAVDLLTDLLGVVSAGDTLGLQAITEATADLLGWFACVECGDLLPVEEVTTDGLCGSCYDGDALPIWGKCVVCADLGRRLNAHGVCPDCDDTAPLTPRLVVVEGRPCSPHGAPIGTRTQLVFGIIPEGYTGDTADLPGDSAVYYWAEPGEIVPGAVLGDFLVSFVDLDD